MTHRITVIVLTCICAAAAVFAGRYWGVQAGSRDALVLSARFNLRFQLMAAQALRDGKKADAQSILDRNINSHVIELNALRASGTPTDRSNSDALLRKVAKYRKLFPDTSAAEAGNLSSPIVEEILRSYADKAQTTN